MRCLSASLLLRCLFGLLLLLHGVALGLNVWHGVPAGNDFVMFHAAARSVLDGASVYQPFLYTPYMHEAWLTGATPTLSTAPLNLNLPLLAWLCLPLGLLPLKGAFVIFAVGQLLAALWVLRRLARVLFPHAPLAFMGVACGLLLYYPTFASLYVGQWGLGLFALLGLFLCALLTGRERQAGVWLGLALSAKLFVGLIFIWLLFTRRWPLLMTGALVWVALMAGGVALLGWDDYRLWAELLPQAAPRALTWNASLWAPLARLWPNNHNSFGVGLSVIVGLPALVALSPLTPRFAVAGLLPLMLLLSPLGWIYYFPLLVLSALLLWPQQKGLTALGAGLAGLPLPLMLPEGASWATLYPLGLLLLVVAAYRAGTSSSAQTGT